jgi:diguanylate cyclase (GGDEF)-like protein
MIAPEIQEIACVEQGNALGPGSSVSEQGGFPADFEAVYAENFAQAQAQVAALQGELFAAVVDLNLPDAPDGEIVDFCLGQKLPTIVLTGSFDPAKREKLLAKGVVDYVTKEGRYSYIYANNLIYRLIKNEKLKVLVVDDSTTGRKFICQLLNLHRYQVLEAVDGIEAIKMVIDHPDIRLLITDYNMPRMDGFELVKTLRVKYEKTDLSIIGLSSESDGSLSAKFIKNGANDFLRKPFNHEEFFCRVTHNVEMLEMIETIRYSSHRDVLTGAFNRHYFFEQGSLQLELANTKNAPIAAAVVDLEGFREVNAHYGQEIGDQILLLITQRLMQNFGRFLIARAGGHEFYALMLGLDNAKAVAFIERIKDIVRAPIKIGSAEVSISISAGVSNITNSTLDDLMINANQCLLRSKDAGGGLILGDEE